ncbi:hypothetical protein EYF80_044938 [Liparis tanakae]|uniref:Uncharacterized protein n=1 Tax=Liparis tanakae TaxID=230148 RepID=A0A4Z2FUL0_9TELE|nr:hypothetical protein EYF80_044938 [Liparis tanakae]
MWQEIQNFTSYGRRLEGVDDIVLSDAGQILLIKEGALEAVTWSGDSFPSSATILLRPATEPNRGTASPTRRYRCPLVLNTRITNSNLPQMMEEHSQ